MNNQESRLVMKEYPIIGGFIGLVFLVIALFFVPTMLKGMELIGVLILLVMIVVGLGMLLFSSILTITADPVTRILTLDSRSLVKKSKREIPFSQIASFELEMNSSTNDNQPTYRIAAILTDGQSVPFRSTYTSGSLSKMKKVEKLRAVIGVGGSEMGLGGMIKMGSQIAQAQFQQQQESMTGSEETEHVDQGVHWFLQTRSYAAMPVTRWFSPDFCTAGEFVFISQKVKGQGSTTGGILASLGKLMMHQVLSVYGFGQELTPNLDGAQFVSNLDQNLETSFSVFASSEYIARQIVNPWVAAPLADWAYRYPLKTIQSNNQIFGQLAVMFSPQGVFVASTGTMIPEAVEELSTVGTALVKAQVSTLRGTAAT